jgi:hypothetical protein
MVKERPPKKEPGRRVTGPRGGTTTVTQTGMFRKNLWITHEQNERLRLLAFRTRRSEGDVIRQGIEFVLALAESAEEDATRTTTTGDNNEEQGDEKS